MEISMIYFIKIISLIVLINGYPQSGYNYNHPSNNGVIGNGNIHGIGHFTGLNGAGSNSNNIGGINSIIGNQFGNNGFINSNTISSSSSSTSHPNNFNSVNGLITSGNINSFGNAGNIGGELSSSSIGSTLIQKHIYVHVPPPEQEDNIQIQRQLSLRPSQKHYKIIFIKAPSLPSYYQQQQTLLQQNQEKTIVYVLVKKPDDIETSQLSQLSSSILPSKPEVYFIKYKAQKESNLGGSSSSTSSNNNINIGNNGGGIITTGHGSSSSIIGSGNSDIISNIGNGYLSPTTTNNNNGFTSSGIASSSIGGGGPAPQYGPPGKSGPY